MLDLDELRAHIDAAAVTYADELFEPMAKQINDNLNEKVVESWNGDLDEEYVKTIILPILKRGIFERLAEKTTEAATAWDEVFWQGWTERERER